MQRTLSGEIKVVTADTENKLLDVIYEVTVGSRESEVE